MLLAARVLLTWVSRSSLSIWSLLRPSCFLILSRVSVSRRDSLSLVILKAVNGRQAVLKQSVHSSVYKRAPLYRGGSLKMGAWRRFTSATWPSPALCRAPAAWGPAPGRWGFSIQRDHRTAHRHIHTTELSEVRNTVCKHIRETHHRLTHTQLRYRVCCEHAQTYMLSLASQRLRLAHALF